MKTCRIVAGIMALALTAGSVGISVSDSEAAVKKPSLKKKTVSVYKGKTAKIQIKGSKIKKTKWSVKKKSYLTLSKKKKTSVTVKGKKKGTTTVTAKVTVKGRKKAYTLKCTVKVKTKSTVTSSNPTVKPTAKPTVKPTQKPNQDVDNSPTLAPVPAASDVQEVTVEKMEQSNPTATSAPDGIVTTETDLNANFESYQIGDAISCSGNTDSKQFEYSYEGNLREGDTIDYFNVRKTGIDTTKNLKATVVDLATAGAPGADAGADVKKNVSGKVLQISGRQSTAQGALLDLTDLAKPGATYEFKAYVKMADNMSIGTTLVCSTETKATQSGKETYANIAKISDSVNSDTGKHSLAEWQEISTTVFIPDDMAHFGFYLECYEDQNTNIYIDGVTFKQTKNPKPYEDIPSLKETYQKYFDYFGCGLGYDSFMGEKGIEFIKKQFNSYTAGNEMKPDAILPDEEKKEEFEFLSIDEAKQLGYYIPEGYEKDESNKKNGQVVVPKLKFDTVDELLAQAKANDIKVRMHVLTWHQQTPTYFFQNEWSLATSKKKNVSKETMDKRLEFYIRTVMDHVLSGNYADTVYSWDVTNEYLHTLNGGQPPTDNFWYNIYDTCDKTYSTQSNMKLNPSYVKLAFQIAHDELVKHKRTDISLIYNDYNTYDVSTDIVRMIRWINTKDSINTYGQICDGIGMQAHLDMTDDKNIPTVEKFANTLEKFRVNLEGLEIAITELDVTLGLNGTADKLDDMDQASYYEDIMRSILACKKRGAKIDSVTLWSLYDGVSWRSAQTPCVFKGLYAPKAAFYALFDAVNTYFPDPFIKE